MYKSNCPLNRLHHSYFEKQQFVPFLQEPPQVKLQSIIVIPCFNEPDLITTLDSLRSCDETKLPVEIIVVINSGKNADSVVLDCNSHTLQTMQLWMQKHNTNHKRYHVIHCSDLPPKRAGVGLARKIGMDEAAYRFSLNKNDNGVIVCLDADCTVQSNYLVEIEKHFSNNLKATGCSVYFEHPLEGKFEPSIYEAITNYELYLRYYVGALRFCGFHAPYHTIGSSMAVTNIVYQKQGGMNQRKAGEDFYFLHKILYLGNFSELNTTTVYPSPRISNRVPFGTGSAISKIITTGYNSYPVYAFESFIILKEFFDQIKTNATSGEKLNIDALAPALKSFLEKQGAASKLIEIASHSTNSKTYLQRFAHWFDGFMVLKCVHYMRDNFLEQEEVLEASKKLMKSLGINTGNLTKREMLLRLRERDRLGS